MEPFYIRQTAEPTGRDELIAWFGMAASEAMGEGAKLCRFSISIDGKTALVEAWDAIAADVGDQGEPRWMLQA